MIHFSVFKLFDFRPPKSRTYASLNSISAKYGLPINTAGFGCQLSIYSWEAPISFMSSRPCDPWKGKRLRLVAPIRGVHERSFGRFLGNLQYRFYCIFRQCLHSVCGILLNDIPTVQTHTKKTLLQVHFLVSHHLLRHKKLWIWQLFTWFCFFLNKLQNALHFWSCCSWFLR